MNTLKFLKFNNKKIKNNTLITDVLVNQPIKLSKSMVRPNIDKNLYREFNI